MRHALLLLLIVSFFPAARAQVPAVAPLAFTSFQLDNGLRVIIHNNKRSRKVFTQVWYEAGSRDEPAGFSGFAHLMEHVAASNATENVGAKEQDETTQAAGGSSNASTSYDRTDYHLEGAHRYLERFLRLLADQMGFLNASISADVYREETKHVLEELKQGENQPGSGIVKDLMKNVFPAGHPYARLPIGSREDLQARDVDDARRFHAKYYWPNNAVLVIVGNVDAVKTRAMILRWFGPLKRGPQAPRVTVPQGSSPVSRAAHVDTRLRDESLLIAWRIPGKGQPGYAELSLFAELLGRGSASRLYDSLVVRRPIMTEVSASILGLQFGGLFTIEGTPADGVTLEQAEQAIMTEVSAMLRERINARRLKAITRGNALGALVASQSNATVAALMAESWAYWRKVDPFYFLNDTANAANDPGRVSAVARHYLKRPDTVMTIHPKARVEPARP